ncbi:MAG: NUDIX hydrolase [Bryobacteraceae bacterium]
MSIERKSRRAVFQNARFCVYADHIAQGAAEVPDYLVVAPHTTREDLVTGVTVLPVRDGQVLLLRNSRVAVGRECLEAVRGFVDVGEDPRRAAVRELEEETGLVCSPGDLLELGFCMPEASTLACRLAIYAAPGCRSGGAREDNEIGLGEARWYTLAEAEALLPTLEDVSTALALHRYLAGCFRARSARKPAAARRRG